MGNKLNLHYLHESFCSRLLIIPEYRQPLMGEYPDPDDFVPMYLCINCMICTREGWSCTLSGKMIELGAEV